MKKNFLLFLLLLLFPLTLGANMASPEIEGGLPASPFISKYVNILHETIIITPEADFNTTSFDVEYQIEALKTGMQIPLLFYASEYNKDFRAWVDGKEIRLTNVPEVFNELEGKQLVSDFAFLYDRSNQEINSSENSSFTVTPSDLKFLEVNIIKGKHTIKVTYIANAWSYLNHWVADKQFRYALSPARYWKSFGTLEVILDNSKTNKKLETNLGVPKVNDTFGISRWEFAKLPMNVIEIVNKPTAPPLAETLIAISPFGLMLIFSAILAVLHIFAIARYRRSNHQGYSVIFITGSVVLPFIALASYLFFIELIDSVLGDIASRRHGYSFLIMFLYVVAMPAYFAVTYIADLYFKVKYRKNNNI